MKRVEVDAIPPICTDIKGKKSQKKIIWIIVLVIIAFSAGLIAASFIKKANLLRERESVKNKGFTGDNSVTADGCATESSILRRPIPYRK